MLSTRSNVQPIYKFEEYIIELIDFFNTHSFPSLKLLSSNAVKVCYHQSLAKLARQLEKTQKDTVDLVKSLPDSIHSEERSDLVYISASKSVTAFPIIWKALQEVLFHLKVIESIKDCEEARAASDEIILTKINIIKEKLCDLLIDEYEKKKLNVNQLIIEMLKGNVNAGLELMDYMNYQRLTKEQINYILIVTENMEFLSQLSFPVSFAMCLRAFVYHFSELVDYSLAASLYESAIEQDQNPIALNNRGHMYLNGHGSEVEEDKAIKLYERAINEYSFDLARLNRSLLHSMKGEYGLAVNLLRTVIFESNNVPPCVLALAFNCYSILHQVGRIPNEPANLVYAPANLAYANEYANKALEGSYYASISVKGNKAAKLIKDGQYEAAVKMLDEMLKFNYLDNIYMRLKIHMEELAKITPALHAFLSEFSEGEPAAIYKKLFLRLGVPKHMVNEIIGFFTNKTELKN